MNGTTHADTMSDDSSPPPSQRVITEIAAATDTDPLDLGPLYDVLDPDALDQLFRRRPSGESRPAGQIIFTMAGCEVRVSSSGDVEAIPLDDGKRGTSTGRQSSHDRVTVEGNRNATPTE